MGYIDVQLSDIRRFIAEGIAYSKLKVLRSYGLGLERVEPVYSRMTVIDVIFDPNDITNNTEDYAAHFSGLGVTNLDYLTILPRNSIVATATGESGPAPPMFLIPFFPPHLAMPIKPGEQVWVYFEDPDRRMGYWISRVNDFQHVDDVNHTHAPRLFDKSMMQPGAADASESPQYEFRNGVVSVDTDGERYTLPETSYLPGGDDAFERLLTVTRSSRMSDYESVPRYRKRPQDFSLEGSNNQLISMGTDRSGPVAVYDTTAQSSEQAVAVPSEDIRQYSGMIDIVVGRGSTIKTSGEVVQNSLDRDEVAKSLSQTTSNEGDPDWKNDRSRLVLVQKSGKLIDGRMSSQVETYVQNTIENNSSVANESNKEENANMSGAAIKADKIRLISRSDIVLVSTNYTVDADGNVVDIDDIDELSSIVLRPGGDIILKPGKNGVVKIGGEDADRAILCTSEPTSVSDGEVGHPGSMVSTMGGHVGTGSGRQGTFSSKVLVKG